ncbi:MAG: hypothetical protein QF886_21270, partial [Planctomycetota bacterium]|nr:hypothetical protein [Planctomycetota bacterium]
MAAIKVKFPLSEIYAGADVVVVGTVAKTEATGRFVYVKDSQTIKGTNPPAAFRLDIGSLVVLFKKITTGEPVVLFISRKPRRSAGVVHIHDQWLMVKPTIGSIPPTWRVVRYYQEAKRSFPGQTEGLIRLLREMKIGGQRIIDKFDQFYFTSVVRKVARIPVRNAAWILAPDLNGNSSPDLVVGTAKTTRLLLASRKGYAEV